MDREPCFVLLSTHDDQVDRWRGALRKLDARILSIGQLSDHTCKPEVVITEGDVAADAPAWLIDLISAGETAVVSIGAASLSDVRLPNDYSDRELRIACQLLTENVRLRRLRKKDRRLQSVLHKMAYLDSLTGLPNRRAWDDAILGQIEQSLQAQRPFCIAMLDLDRFKRINDRGGFTVGDRVLRTFGRSLAQQAEPAWTVARMGGDEFGVIFAELSADRALEHLEKLRTQAGAQVKKRCQQTVTASGGLVECDGFGQAARNTLPAQLLALAAQALHQAKRRGRNRVVGCQFDSQLRIS